MRIGSRDIPQADKLEGVLSAAEAVANGARTFQDISSWIGRGERNGRYYRRAAEILGLIRPAGKNLSGLTQLGEEYVYSRGIARAKLIASAVLSAPVIQRVLPLLEARGGAGITRSELEVFVADVTGGARSTTHGRRTSTIVSWLRSAGLLDEKGDRYHLRSLPEGVGVVEYAAVSEPLLPHRYDLKEYIEAARRARGGRAALGYEVAGVTQERANRTHGLLTALVARRVRAQGAVPRCNALVDLAARVGGVPYIFEVKTTNRGNVRSQIRLGLSQLYEYRYLQSAPDARLVLVLQNPVAGSLGWMKDYLSEDREVFLLWDGDRRTLHCMRQHREVLGFAV